MRVSNQMIYDQFNKSLQRTYQDLLTKNDQLSSGKRILKPSDDVLGTVQSMDYKLSINSTEQFLKNNDAVSSNMTFNDQIMTSLSGTLTRVKELALQGANGTEDSQSRSAIAQEVGDLRDQIFALSNSKNGNRYMFSGTNTDKASFTYESTTGSYDYQGNDQLINLSTDEGLSAPINVPGSELFAHPVDPLNVSAMSASGATATAAIQNPPGPTSVSLDSYRITFTAPTTYDVDRIDPFGTPTKIVSGATLAANNTIDLTNKGDDPISVAVNGNPATGDTFVVSKDVVKLSQGTSTSSTKELFVSDVSSGAAATVTANDPATLSNYSYVVRYNQAANDFTVTQFDPSTGVSTDLTPTIQNPGGATPRINLGAVGADAINVTFSGNLADGDRFRISKGQSTNFVNYVSGPGNTQMNVMTYSYDSSTGTLTKNAPISFKNDMELTDRLQQALESNDVLGIQALLNPLDDAAGQVIDNQAVVGARLNGVDNLTSRLNDSITNQKKALSNVQDADITQVVSDISKAQTALQALQLSSVKILTKSLFDYLT